MARPSKTTDVLKAEGKSHRTKAELAAREAAEKAFATGKAAKARHEVKINPEAYKEFKRVTSLLSAVGKNDALFESIINRYCLLQSECSGLISTRAQFEKNLAALLEDDEIDADSKYRLMVKMQQNILDIDKDMQSKRKMILDIEKECSLTINAAMRTVPKQPTTPVNPLASILGDDDDD